MLSDVTVLIPHFNRAELLDRALATLAGQSAPPLRVLVVDGGSTDATRDVVGRHSVELLELGANRGFAPAVNAGLAATTTRWVAVINNDVELEPGCLAALLEDADLAGASFATPRLRQLRHPARLDGCYDLLARSGCAWRAGHDSPDSPAYSEPRRIWFPPLTCTLLRHDLFERLGGLDERFESYLEDVEFGLRCVRAGLAGVYVPRAVAYHAGSSTLGAWSPRMVELIARNQILLAAKHLPPAYWWHIAIGQALWGLLALRRGTGTAWTRGKLAGLRLGRAVRASSSPALQAELDPILRAAETEIRHSPLAGGYWRAYFALTSS
jgi:GT2 family glycosyltransferase